MLQKLLFVVAFIASYISISPSIQSHVVQNFFLLFMMCSFCEKKERPMSRAEKRRLEKEEKAKQLRLAKEKKQADLKARREKCNHTKSFCLMS